MFKTQEGLIKPVIYVGIVKQSQLLLVQYHQAPNPEKSGWWIPAPGLEFGEDPREKAQATLAGLGLAQSPLRLHDVESFVTPGGWHLLYHFIATTDTEPAPAENMKAYKWVGASELAEMKDIAHGKWEIGVGLSYLQNHS